MKRKIEEFDVIVIGSGGGMKIAVPAVEMGLKTLLIEKGSLGGTCLNRGCIPSKMLIYPGEFLRECRRAGRLDLEVAPRAVRFSELTQRIEKTIAETSGRIEKMLAGMELLELVRAPARFVGERLIEADDRRFRGKKIFVATGSRPRLPPIEGLDRVPCWTSTEALRARELPRRLLVIGGGFIACELGDAYSAFGSEVSFVAPVGLIDRQDEDIREEFVRVFSRHNTIYDGAAVRRVSREGWEFRTELELAGGKSLVVASDAVLVAAGVVPDTAGLGLPEAGIGVNRQGFIEVDDNLATAAEGVYAFGDCIGNYMFRHSVNFEGEYLVRSALEGDRRPIRYYPVPSAMFSWPEVAGVGKLEKELERDGVEYVRGWTDYPTSNAGIARRIDHGFVKILVGSRDRRLLGAHIVGPEASDMIHTFIALLYMNADLDDLLRLIYIHPALPELIRDAARAAAEQLKA